MNTNIYNNNNNNDFQSISEEKYFPPDLLDIKLEAGDIIFSCDVTKKNSTHLAIRVGQSAMSALTSGKINESCSDIHVAIYDGNGNLIEALSEGLVITPIQDYDLGKGKELFYEIFRPKDRDWAHRAGVLAKQCAVRGEDTPIVRSSMKNAPFSLVKNSKHVSLKKFKDSCDIARKEKLLEKPTGSSPRILGSEFVTQMLLSVEADRVYFQAKKEGVKVDKRYMKENAQFLLNPRGVSPRVLHKYLIQHPIAFEKVGIIANTVSENDVEREELELQNRIIVYPKGQTRHYIPTRKDGELGRGMMGTVGIHRHNPDHVVKKSDNLLIDYRIGKKINGHPLFVETHNLYIKKYKDLRPDKHKLKVERFRGFELRHLYNNIECKLTKDSTISILNSLKNGVSFLYDQKVAWCDVNPGNILVSSDGNIKIIDYGLWSYKEDPVELTKGLLFGSMEVIGLLMNSSFLTYQKDSEISDSREYERKNVEITEKIQNVVFPNQIFKGHPLRPYPVRSQIMEMYKEHFINWVASLKVEDLSTDEERKEFLINYIDEAIKQIELLEEPISEANNGPFTAPIPENQFRKRAPPNRIKKVG